MNAVEVHACGDRRVERGGVERELPAHAEAYRADLRRRRVRQEVTGGAAQILFSLPDVERHEELAGAVRLAGRLAVIHVRGERRESFRGEAVAAVLDVVDQTPPLLEYQDARPLAAGRRG